MAYAGNGWGKTQGIGGDDAPTAAEGHAASAGSNGVAPDDVHSAPTQQSVVSRPPDGLITRGLTGAVRLSVSAIKLPLRLARPVVMSRPMAPARDAANAVVNKVSDALISVVAEQLLFNNEAQMLVEEYTERLLLLLAQNRLVEQLVRAQAERYIGYLAENPRAVAPLVEAAANQYIVTLQQNPTRIQSLVRSAAGDYIAFLVRNPDVVEALVATAAGDYVATLQQRPDLVDGLVRTVGNRYIAYLTESTKNVEALVQSVAGSYIEYLSRNPDVAGGLVENVAGDYIAYLQAQPEVLDGVVAGAAERFMAAARADPAELDALVQVVGDRYMEYLRVYPDNVQDLLAGQTASITGDVITEVRQRSASGDARLESALRSLLRMKPRDDKPLPDIEPPA